MLDELALGFSIGWALGAPGHVQTPGLFYRDKFEASQRGRERLPNAARKVTQNQLQIDEWPDRYKEREYERAVGNQQSEAAKTNLRKQRGQISVSVLSQVEVAIVGPE